MRKTDLVFFLTGAAALVYEVAWARMLARVLGSDASANGVVIATFMGGMGAGALLAGGIARRATRPVRLFAALEIGIAIWAVLSPALLGLLHPVDGFGPRALVAAAILLPPTLCMGATFPLMGRLSIRAAQETGSETGAFYGANTLGAAAGALLAPFVLMPRTGLAGALYAAAAIDAAAAVLALAILRAPEPETDEPRGARAPWSESILWAALLMGAASLALEVLLARVLSTVTGASVYALAIVLAVFLLGIGIGSRQHAQRARGGKGRARMNDVGVLFACAMCVPLLALAGLWALRGQLGENDLFGSLGNRVPELAGRFRLARLWASHALLAAIALLPPAIAFGMALPAAAGALAARHPQLPRERLLAQLYGFNTAGALGGSLLAAFVALPAFGPRVAVAIALALPLLAALLVPTRRPALWLLGLAASAMAALPGLGAGASDRGVRFHEFDAHTSAAVIETRTAEDGLVLSLRVNGKPEASTGIADRRLQLLLGHVPGLLHGGVKDALVVGLGTGMTAGSLLDLPTLEHLAIVEISPAVTRAATYFAAWNGAVQSDPRVTVRIADGRHALAREERLYDLITSDPVHPWTRGSSDLYTVEHFRNVAARLAPGGVASQWLPLYELSTQDVKTVVATWCAAFPRASAWLTAYDLVLVGSRDPLGNEGRLADAELPPRVGARLAELGIRSSADVAALQVADDADLRAFAADAPPMRDDRPVLEFRAPLSFLSGYSVEALRWAGRDGFVEKLQPASRDEARRVRSALARFLDRLPQGLGPAAGAYGRELLAPPPLAPR